MLTRKLWRDIKGNYGAYLAVVSVMIIGLMLYAALSVIMDNLSTSQENYYREDKFAGGFAQIVRGPESLAGEVDKVKGVTAVTGRIIKDVFVNTPEGAETKTLRLVSFQSPNQRVNRFRLVAGRIPREGEREILISPAFLTAGGYLIGDQLPLIIAGKEINFKITGTAISPEFIYEIPNGQTIAPNPKTFGIGYLNFTVLSSLLGMDRQVNNLAFTLAPGTEFAAVKQPLTTILDHYGLTQLYARRDQLSHSVFTQEIKGLKATAQTTPVIFLLVAASILYIMLRRMVEQQRGQIGVMKAFGFTDREIINHYLSFALLIGFVGGLGGGLAGSLLSFPLAKIYQHYFNLPALRGSFAPGDIIAATLLSCVFSAIAGWRGARQVLTLTPADAMRAPTPKATGKTLIERINIIWQLLNSLGKMAARNLFRSRSRTILAILGIATAFSLMVASAASLDATDLLMNFQFDQVEKYDMKVALNQFTGKNEAAAGGRHLRGVTMVEPELEVPATISHRWLKKDTVITGLERNSRLFRLITSKGDPVDLPKSGLVVSSQLAKILDLKPGDTVTVKPLLGDKQERLIRVAQVIPQYVGLGAYMEIDALSRVMNARPAASAVLLKVKREQYPEVRKILQEGKNVLALEDKTKIKAQYDEMMASSKSTIWIMLLFAFITGFAIVYNVTLISLAERERELATLLVLGMTEAEVGHILLYEQTAMGILGILTGIPFSYGILYAMATGTANDMYNLPMIISAQSFITGIIGTILCILVAQWRINGRIGSLSMLEVLKQQD